MSFEDKYTEGYTLVSGSIRDASSIPLKCCSALAKLVIHPHKLYLTKVLCTSQEEILTSSTA